MTALAFHLPHTPATLAFAAIAILLVAGFVAHCFHDAMWVDEYEMPCDPPDVELAGEAMADGGLG